jgi:hypothetical protein
MVKKFFPYIIYVLVVASIIPLSSCHNPDLFPHDPRKFKTYFIKKGNHYCSHTFHFFRDDVMEFAAEFDESAIYDHGSDYEQSDINKLFGFVDCGSAVHVNSARFGWRWYNNRLEIFAYCYNNGVRMDKYMTAIRIGQVYVYKITATSTYYVFEVDGVSVVIPRGCNESYKKEYLYPYFGGTLPAPHDISIKIKVM